MTANRTLINSVLMVSAVLLSANIYFMSSEPLTMYPSGKDINNTPEEEPVTISNIDLSNLGSLEDYNLISERPLFHADRKPFILKEVDKIVKKKETVKKTLNVKKKAEQLKLNAVIITNDKQIAILQNARDKTTQRTLVGENFQGWILNQVESHQVVLSKEGETKTLELEIVPSKLKRQNGNSNQKKEVLDKKVIQNQEPASEKQQNARTQKENRLDRPE